MEKAKETEKKKWVSEQVRTKQTNKPNKTATITQERNKKKRNVTERTNRTKSQFSAYILKSISVSLSHCDCYYYCWLSPPVYFIVFVHKVFCVSVLWHCMCAYREWICILMIEFAPIQRKQQKIQTINSKKRKREKSFILCSQFLSPSCILFWIHTAGTVRFRFELIICRSLIIQWRSLRSFIDSNFFL